MKIVHLYANWKWTGPAEPAVSLAAGLARRGHEVTFLPGRPVAGVAFEEGAAGEGPEESCQDDGVDDPECHRRYL